MKEDILEHAQKRANALRELWARLRIKYNELDAIMGELTFIPTFSHIFKIETPNQFFVSNSVSDWK